MSIERTIDKQLLLDSNHENEAYNKEHIVELGNGKLIKFTSRQLIKLADSEKILKLFHLPRCCVCHARQIARYLKEEFKLAKRV